MIRYQHCAPNVHHYIQGEEIPMTTNKSHKPGWRARARAAAAEANGGWHAKTYVFDPTKESHDAFRRWHGGGDVVDRVTYLYKEVPNAEIHSR